MVLRAMRFFGAIAILAVGAVHLQQYIGADYRAIPTVGTLFLLNAIASGIVGIALLVPIERMLADRRAHTALGLLALTGAGIALGSLIALFVSEGASLFGFSESGYRTPIVIAVVAEAAAIALLGPVAVARLAHAVSGRPNATARHRGGRDARLDYGTAR